MKLIADKAYLQNLMKKLDPGPLMSNGVGLKNQQGMSLLMLFLILIGNALFLQFNAFRCFSHYDMSSWLDASWRVFKGQKPYIDFWFWAGPVHIYIVAAFFHIFGFGKLAVWAHLVFVSSSAIALSYAIVRKTDNLRATFAVLFLSAACFYWNIAFPYHSQTTHLFGFLAITALVLGIPFSSRGSAFSIGLWCGITSALSLMTKANIAFAYGLAIGVTLLASRKVLWSLSGYTLGVLGGVATIWVLFGLGDTFMDQTFKVYFGNTSNRIRGLFYVGPWVRNFYWIPFLLVSISMFVHKENRKKAYPYFILFLGCTFLGIFTAVTDSMIPTTNYPIWGAYMGIALLTVGIAQENSKKYELFDRLIRVLLLLTIAGMSFVSVVKGIRLTTWRQIGMSPIGNYHLQTEPLKGWRSDREIGMAIDDLAQFIHREVAKDDSLLILTALQILYALTERDSFRGVPFAWNPMWDFDEKRMYAQAKKVIMNDPPDWIIYHPQTLPSTTMVSLSNHAMKYCGIEDFVEDAYHEVYESGPFKVLRRNSD